LNSDRWSLNPETTIVCIVGLGYVGLPLAEAFARYFKVTGFDSNADKINRLTDKNSTRFTVTADPSKINQADFIIICVPTPVTPAKEPDLSYVEHAARDVGRNMKSGVTVVLESTVYPGVTEEIVVPILEQESGLKCGQDFKVGYCPERINPGDNVHTVDKTIKVVAGMDQETTETLAALYGTVAPSIYTAGSIKTAEAAKVIENIQRDLNIALMNELAIIFQKMGLNTREVLDAASTKWNFHHYTPGLVGGHCIPVDPYYLVHKTKELGYQPQVILAGRNINDSMPAYVSRMTTRALVDAGKSLAGSRVLIMGLTYKENVADTRESPVLGIIKELENDGIKVYGHDPFLDNIDEEFKIQSVTKPEELHNIDAIIVTVGHDSFKKISLGQLRNITSDNPVLVDVKQVFDRNEAAQAGFHYYTL